MNFILNDLKNQFESMTIKKNNLGAYNLYGLIQFKKDLQPFLRQFGLIFYIKFTFAKIGRKKDFFFHPM